MERTGIGGIYQRVVEPEWLDPLDPSYSVRHGGRWNAPESHAALYLNADVVTARANVKAKFDGLPYGAQDLDPADAPHLVEVEVAAGVACEVRTPSGLTSVGLPPSYPRDLGGGIVPWSDCQPIGAVAHSTGLDGVACRSAVLATGEELAWFPPPLRAAATVRTRAEFSDWYWLDDVR